MASSDKAAISNWNTANVMTWIMSGILLSVLQSLFWTVSNQCHPRSRGQKMSYLKFWVWVVWCMFLDQIFVMDAKNDRSRLFERSKSGKNENRKNMEILINGMKMAFLGRYSKRQSSVFFHDRDLKFCTRTYSSASVLTYLSCFFS